MHAKYGIELDRHTLQARPWRWFRARALSLFSYPDTLLHREVAKRLEP